MSNANTTLVKAVQYYRIFCITEAKYNYIWASTLPTVCPTNSLDTIDASSIAIIDSCGSPNVKIIQESGVTGGSYCCESKSVTIPANTTTSSDFSWAFPISVICVYFVSDLSHQGDTIKTTIKPDTIIGTITSNVAVGDTIINVSPTVVKYMNIGYHMTLFDGVNSSNLMRVIAIDSIHNTLTMESPSTIAFSSTTPTYCQMNIINIFNYEIGPPNRYEFGQHSIGCSYLPANTKLRFNYTNKSTTNSKYFVYCFQYFY